MGLLSVARRLINAADNLPGIRQWRVRRYEDYFASHTGDNIYRGVFDSFEAAAASAPQRKPLGYDNETSAHIYAERLQRILPSDYPAMLWLGKFWSEGCRSVLDHGGNVGECYYAYRRLLDYPADLRWTVSDVPLIVALGRKMAMEHDVDKQLLFADDFSAADGVDVLLVNGVLQFLPGEFEELMSKLPTRPKNLIINRLPLHPTHTFFTLQSIGSAFCPYRVRDEAGFLATIQVLGYDIVDRWQIPELSCDVPFYPSHHVSRYQGFSCVARPKG